MSSNSRLSKFLSGSVSQSRSGASDASEPDVRLTVEDAIGALDNHRRRRVLDALDETPSTTIRELTEQLAAWENDVPIARLNSAQKKRVYVSLYQTHLDTLDSVDVIDYDSDRGTIRRGPAFESGAEILSAIRTECDPE